LEKSTDSKYAPRVGLLGIARALGAQRGCLDREVLPGSSSAYSTIASLVTMRAMTSSSPVEHAAT